jgi:hypothetical protein
MQIINSQDIESDTDTEILETKKQIKQVKRINKKIKI